MTQPNPYGQQQYGAPPNGFGSGGAPQNFQQFQQPQQTQATYAPPQQTQFQQPAAPAQTHQHAPSFDNAEDPRAFGGLAPRPRHLQGRTVIYMPKRVDKNAKDMQGQPKDTPNVYGSLFVIDGGPVAFGDKQKSGGIVERPNTHTVQTPAYFDSVIVGEWEIAKALEAACPPFGNGLVIGVIERGTKGNQPFMLNTIDKADPRRNLARQVYEAWQSGQWQSPQPEPIQVAPGSMATGQAQNFGQPMAQQQYAQPAQNAAGGFGQQQGNWGQPQTMGGQTTGWTGQAAPQSAPPANWGPQPGQVAQTPQGFSIDQPAPGWDPGMWSQLPEANRQQIWQAVMAQQQGGQTGNPAALGQPTGF